MREPLPFGRLEIAVSSSAAAELDGPERAEGSCATLAGGLEGMGGWGTCSPVPPPKSKTPAAAPVPPANSERQALRFGPR